MKTASVIIPHYNDAPRLRLCLDALSRQTLPSDAFEVIVVDNNSTSPPRELVEGYPFCRFTSETRAGSYASRNRGLEVASGRVLAFTDSDCLPEPGWLEAGVARVTRGPAPGQVGGAIQVFPADGAAPTAAELYDMLYGLRQEVNVGSFRFAATANMFTTREVFDAVGLFNPNLKSGGDFEWGRRVADSGRPVVYAPEAVVRHPARRALGDLLRQARRHMGGHVDKFHEKSGNKSIGRLTRNLWRIASPPVGESRDAVKQLRQRGYSLRQATGVVGVVFAIKYVRLIEVAKRFAGAQAERQ
ncbi:glycosyltransferase family A protein [Botrimarina sp.]|uniref:glycosyltransferase family 2 protein n=1 Tax=Botrimarina sp. TaxID=2795802 RepID=UPI0032ECE32E